MHGEPLCQCELLPLFDGMSQPLLSYHLSRLAAAGLVEVERAHRWASYSASEDGLQELTGWLSR